MPRYRTRYRAVDAVQITEEWFDRPWLAPPGVRVHKQRRVVVVTPGDLAARVGSWIVDDRFEQGLRVFTDEEFTDRYEADGAGDGLGCGG